MSLSKPRSLLRLDYANAAQAYLRSLPPEHFMEAKPQATQREITLASLALLRQRRPDLHYFNELLVQYPFGRSQQIQQVVPDNMIVLHPEPLDVDTSYDLPFQPVAPFWVLEYVSKNNQRKDYETSFHKYEHELKVPYYLLFYPAAQELTLYQRAKRKYRATPPNAAHRYAVDPLDVEVAILDGWVRFYHRNELLPLPADLQRALDDLRLQLRRSQQQTRHAQEQAQQAQQERDQALFRAARLAELSRKARRGQATPQELRELDRLEEPDPTAST